MVQYGISSADIDYRNSESGPTTLLVAIRDVDPTIVQLLLQNGADPTVRKQQQPQLCWPRSSETALLQAAPNADHSEAIIRLLVNHGAIPHGPGNCQALLLVIKKGDASLFRLLVDHGAPLEHRLTRIPTLIRTALLSGRAAIVDLLLEMRMTPSERDLDIVRNITPEGFRMLRSRVERKTRTEGPRRLMLSA
ncbi:hypothetical protein BDW72DRAFT_30629 [Aspergillus terricola var. indicus]